MIYTSLLTSLAFLLLLLLIYIYISIIQHEPSSIDPKSFPSFLIPSTTTHHRYLPSLSKHIFSYNILILGVDIDSISNGECDLPFGIFKFGRGPRMLGLSSEKYLLSCSSVQTQTPRQTLRAKVEDVLSDYGISSAELGRVWLVTIPSILGWEGPIPLSIWFCYKPVQKGMERGVILCVILEVGTIAGETHSYVLKMDSIHRHDPAAGYDLGFTFPRSFHVSPFNSRNGYYRVDLVNPFPQTSLTNTNTTGPLLKVSVKLLTQDRKIKLLATLHNNTRSPAIPLEPRYIFKVLKAILKWPFTLVTYRTIYQAYLLHYAKKLAVYPRPEPVFDGARETAEEQINPPEKDEERVGRPLRVMKESDIEIMAKGIIVRWARGRVDESGIGLSIEFTDRRETIDLQPTIKFKEMEARVQPDRDEETLVINAADSYFFSHLLMVQSPESFFLFAPERMTSISSREKFVLFFAPSTHNSQKSNLASRLGRIIRYRLAVNKLRVKGDDDDIDGHYLDSSVERWTIFNLLFKIWLEENINRAIQRFLKPSFVRGTEPSLLWDRASNRTDLSSSHEGDGEGNEVDVGSERYDE